MQLIYFSLGIVAVVTLFAKICENFCDKRGWKTQKAFTLAFAIAATAATVFAMWMCSQTLTSIRWTPVQAVITKSWVEKTLGSAAHSGGRIVTYAIQLEYRYSVANRTYTGSRLSMTYPYMMGGMDMYSGDAEKDRQQGFTEGSSVIAYVDPAHPEQATLRRGFSYDEALSLFFVPFFLWLLCFNYWITGGRPGRD